MSFFCIFETSSCLLAQQQDQVESKMDETTDNRANIVSHTEKTAAETGRLVSQTVFNATDTRNSGKRILFADFLFSVTHFMQSTYGKCTPAPWMWALFWFDWDFQFIWHVRWKLRVLRQKLFMQNVEVIRAFIERLGVDGYPQYRCCCWVFKSFRWMNSRNL